MNNEKLKQIQEAIINTVSCIDAHNGDHLTNMVLNAHLKALTAMEAEALGGLSSWVSVLDRLPERGVTVMVLSQDGEIYFDEIDEDCDDGDRWYAHDQSYEHYCNVAKPSGSVGPDCEAPYTHWMHTPKPPAE